MDVIMGAESLRYVNQQQENFQESRRRVQDTIANPSETTEADENCALDGPHVTAGISKRIPAEIFPQTRRVLENNKRTHHEQNTEDCSPCWGGWSDSSSVCSTSSNSTTISEAAFKAHEDTQFARLLPRESAESPDHHFPIKRSLLGSLRKSLRPKLRISEFIGAANAGFTRIVDDRSNHDPRAEPCDTKADKSSIPTVKASLKKEPGQSSSGKEAQQVFVPACLPKRDIPRGRELREMQLTLQENILSDIADRAIDGGPENSKGGKVKWQNSPTASEEGPEDLDRELEITRELMKQLRSALNDGSHQDMYLVDSDDKGESGNEKYEILCDVLLMLRRAFRDILARYERPYRPTGFAVTDLEMGEAMEEQLLAREKLMNRYPSMAIEEMLESLAGVGHEADLKTLADL